MTEIQKKIIAEIEENISQMAEYVATMNGGIMTKDKKDSLTATKESIIFMQQLRKKLENKWEKNIENI